MNSQYFFKNPSANIIRNWCTIRIRRETCIMLSLKLALWENGFVANHRPNRVEKKSSIIAEYLSGPDPASFDRITSRFGYLRRNDDYSWRASWNVPMHHGWELRQTAPPRPFVATPRLRAPETPLRGVASLCPIIWRDWKYDPNCWNFIVFAFPPCNFSPINEWGFLVRKNGCS